MNIFSIWRRPKPTAPTVAEIPTRERYQPYERRPAPTELLEAALDRVMIDFRARRDVEYRWRLPDGTFTPWARPTANFAVAPPVIGGEGAIEWRTRR